MQSSFINWFIILSAFFSSGIAHAQDGLFFGLNLASGIGNFTSKIDSHTWSAGTSELFVGVRGQDLPLSLRWHGQITSFYRIDDTEANSYQGIARGISLGAHVWRFRLFAGSKAGRLTSTPRMSSQRPNQTGSKKNPRPQLDPVSMKYYAPLAGIEFALYQSKSMTIDLSYLRQHLMIVKPVELQGSESRFSQYGLGISFYPQYWDWHKVAAGSRSLASELSVRLVAEVTARVIVNVLFILFR